MLGATCATWRRSCSKSRKAMACTRVDTRA
jgi:hypothetical protein